MGKLVAMICPTAKGECFWRGGLDRANHVEFAGRFRLYEHALKPHPDTTRRRHCVVSYSVVQYLSAGYGMIVSFRDEWLREFFVNDIRSKKIPSDLEDRLFRKIQMIDDATTDRDLRSPPSNHFEKLRGNLDGLHSIRVNKRWRLVFRWDSGRGEAKDLYLDDHSYV
jgi:toxin HigB-1